MQVWNLVGKQLGENNAYGRHGGGEEDERVSEHVVLRLHKLRLDVRSSSSNHLLILSKDHGRLGDEHDADHEHKGGEETEDAATFFQQENGQGDHLR